MGKIIVATLYRLMKDGDKFSKKENHRVVERTNVKIDKDFVVSFNKNWETSGQLYEIDEKETKKRDKKLEKSINEENTEPNLDVKSKKPQ